MLRCVPETVQTPAVVEVKLTVRLEVAVADSVSGVPTVWVGMAPKLMVCEVRGAGLTVKLCGTIAAAA